MTWYDQGLEMHFDSLRCFYTSAGDQAGATLRDWRGEERRGNSGLKGTRLQFYTICGHHWSYDQDLGLLELIVWPKGILQIWKTALWNMSTLPDIGHAEQDDFSMREESDVPVPLVKNYY